MGDRVIVSVPAESSGIELPGPDLRVIGPFVVVAVVVLLWLRASFARADAVGPPPECPHGGTPETGHAGPYCAAEPCVSDDQCRGGVCREVAVCIGRIVGWSISGPGATNETVEGACSSGGRAPALGDGAGGRCAKGTCASRRLCVGGASPHAAVFATTEPSSKVPRPPVRASEEDDDCTVHAVRGGVRPSARGLLFGALALVVAVRARSRRRAEIAR